MDEIEQRNPEADSSARLTSSDMQRHSVRSEILPTPTVPITRTNRCSKLAQHPDTSQSSALNSQMAMISPKRVRARASHGLPHRPSESFHIAAVPACVTTATLSLYPPTVHRSAVLVAHLAMALQFQWRGLRGQREATVQSQTAWQSRACVLARTGRTYLSLGLCGVWPTTQCAIATSCIDSALPKLYATEVSEIPSSATWRALFDLIYILSIYIVNIYCCNHESFLGAGLGWCGKSLFLWAGRSGNALSQRCDGLEPGSFGLFVCTASMQRRHFAAGILG